MSVWPIHIICRQYCIIQRGEAGRCLQNISEISCGGKIYSAKCSISFMIQEGMTRTAANESDSLVAATPGCRAQRVAEYQLIFRKNMKKIQGKHESDILDPFFILLLRWLNFLCAIPQRSFCPYLCLPRPPPPQFLPP